MIMNRANELMSPGYLPFETGYHRLDAVQMEVAALHRLPGVTGAMFDWWFANMNDAERYRMWHPGRHKAFEWIDGKEPGKYIGATFVATQSLMDGEDDINPKFRFHDPDEMLDTSRFEERGVSAAVCMRVGPREAPFWAGKIVHVARDIEGGCEIRSRFWLGDTGRKEEAPHRDVIAQVVNDDFAEAILKYNLEQMAYLGNFLPELYGKEVKAA